ncbi:helix-turn-helix domain-containing protein [Shouchella lonarensis]|uniref:Helix-turn-helix n=1 Tax=Shouchella lonarensis TaxID=1464122 RepID=A0A1G6IWP1_9BACI|nr:helix-turn-helix transcriptional regulator [Shouchella lonarensis]SDC10495.1 Helix-turn-helix [Shouchella lonarensis]
MFPQRLKECRLKARLTMKEVGQTLNMAQSTISGYENGSRKPDLDNLHRLADFYNVSCDFLLGRTDEQTEMLFPPTTLSEKEQQFLQDALNLYRKYR